MSLEACAHNPVKSQFVFNINVINSMLSLSYGVMNQQQKKTKRLGEYWHSSVKDLRL